MKTTIKVTNLFKLKTREEFTKEVTKKIEKIINIENKKNSNQSA